MKLYKNNEGVWAGTQADARKMCGKGYQTVDVPTDKPSLLRFLNANKVGAGISDSDDIPVAEGGVDMMSMSWFKWAYDKFLVGDYDEGKEMLKAGLKALK